jgi:hypothetical protein
MEIHVESHAVDYSNDSAIYVVTEDGGRSYEVIISQTSKAQAQPTPEEAIERALQRNPTLRRAGRIPDTEFQGF